MAMTVVVEEQDRDIEYIEGVDHVHFQVDNWVTVSKDGEDDRTFRVHSQLAISVVSK